MRDNLLENFSYFLFKIAKIVFKIALYFLIMYFIGIALFNFGNKLFHETAMDTNEPKEIIFEIKSDDSLSEVAKNLKEAGLIEDPFIFKFRATIYKTKLTPNIYSLKTSMTIKNMLDIFDSPTENYIVLRNEDEEEDVYQLSPEIDMEETSTDSEEEE